MEPYIVIKSRIYLLYQNINNLKLTIMTKINYNKHIWEGWTVQNFIDELEPIIEYQKFVSAQELKDWCKDNQPYYKKHIPEVFNHFKQKLNL